MYNEKQSDELDYAKRVFQWNLSKAKKAKEEWAKDEPQVICKYLSEVHNIRVPDDFAEQMVSAHKQFYTAEKRISLPFETIDAIISSCNMWKDYIDDSEGIFEQLVCMEILRMLRIKTSVIASRNFAEKQNLPLKKQPPYLLTTIVTEYGALRVYS